MAGAGIEPAYLAYETREHPLLHPAKIFFTHGVGGPVTLQHLYDGAVM